MPALSMFFGRAMAVLKRANKAKLDSASEWQLLKLNPSQETLLQTLGLLEAPAELPKRKRGRLKKGV